MGTHNLCFKQKYENSPNFLCENLSFLGLKFSVYLNRRVFVLENKHFSKFMIPIPLARVVWQS